MTSESVMLGSSVCCFENRWLLAAASEILGVPRAHVRALEVSSEGFHQVVPVGDLRRRQMLQPGSGGVGEEQGEVADDDVVIVRSTQLAGQPVVRKPQLRPCFPQVLNDGSRGSEPGRERRPSYGPAEGLRTWWFGRGAPILLAVVASSTARGSLGAPSRRGGLNSRGGGARCRGDPGLQVWNEASRMNREVAVRCSEGHPCLRE
jgi:hypothetical protein